MGIRKVRRYWGGQVLWVGLSLSCGPALAMPTPFQVNPGNLDGLSGPGSFPATFIDFSYSSLVDQQIQPDGSILFSQEGLGTFGTFRHPTLSSIVSPLTSGLLVQYNMYWMFSSFGTVTVTPGGLVVPDFQEVVFEVWVDPLNDTQANDLGTGDIGGVDQDGFDHPTSIPVVNDSGNPGFVFSNTDDDERVLSSIQLFQDDILIDPAPGTTNQGSFSVSVLLNSDIGDDGDPSNDFFTGTAFTFDRVLADFNGVNTSLTGLNPGSFVDGILDGSGNLSFQEAPPAQVPVVGSLLLLGTGLAGMIGVRRRVLL